MVKIYLARSMSGRIKEEVVEDAIVDRVFLESAGFIVLCPVMVEGVKATKDTLQASKEEMDSFWFRDKEMIREANVVFDMSPDRKSEGVAHELGYARYSLWKPVVRVYPPGKLPPRASVAYFEDDYVCDSLIEAIEYVLRVHGTFYKRLMWRLDLLNRCILKWILFQIKEIK